MTNAAALSRTLFISDNLPVLRGIDSESVDLIATDPPFNKGVKAFEGIVAAGVGKAGQEGLLQGRVDVGRRAGGVGGGHQERPPEPVRRHSGSERRARTWARSSATWVFVSWSCTVS